MGRRRRSTLAVAAAVLAAALARPAVAQDASVANVTPAFRPGPYTTLSVDLADPYRVAVGTADGYVVWSDDGGRTTHESRAVSARRYDPMTIRSGAMSVLAGGNVELPGQDNVVAGDAPDRSLRMFLSNLLGGTPPARHAFWMEIVDPVTDITAIAWPGGAGKLAVAAPAGLLLSDRGRSVWTRTAGGPGPMPRERDLKGLSIAIDPTDPRHVLAGTDRGILVSDDGGFNFRHHTDPKTAADYVTRLLFDPENPDLVFAVTPDAVMLSEDGGKSFQPAFSTGTDIFDLALSAEAALISSADGLHVATADGVSHLLPGIEIIGAVPWRDGSVLAASKEAIYQATLDGARVTVLQTHSGDPFLALRGTADMAFAITPTTIVRFGAPTARARPLGYTPPRVTASLEEVERRVVELHGLPPPGERYLHPRWYAQLLPEVELTARGGLHQQNRLLFDGEFPARYRYAEAYAQSHVGLEVMVTWDLSQFVFGDESNVVHPDMVVESNLRAGLDMVLREVRSRYREAASLAELLAAPPADPMSELLWRMRLEELGSYLEIMSGDPVVVDNDLEFLR